MSKQPVDVSLTTTIEVAEQSQVGEARRVLVALARDNGLEQAACDRLSLICQEMSTNLLKHTKSGGKLLFQSITTSDGNVGVDLYCVDSGRGMDVEACKEDGYSSSGTLGNGIGAIHRLADESHLHSVLQTGTVIHARVWNTHGKKPGAFEWGALSIPKKGELLCGDKWALHIEDNFVYCMVVDGLGHGIEASDAAILAVKRFRQNLNLPPAAMLKALHTSLRGSRGAVGAVAKLDRLTNILYFCGLGNIDGVLTGATGVKRLVSLNGTLGYEGRKFNEFSFLWTPDSTLVMHSDGFSSKTLNGFVALGDPSPALAAGWLYKMHAKDIDDATIFVLKQTRRAKNEK